ncbi:Hypothetical predicted protein [Mytilus galloprovincialis]|uniref:Cytosolic fatty-acid binding proteins domain-containing protein n=1 Tax=Mytilus galloprovincialis TaxID=29158 RepID=A0A8B6HHV6_MYTGA|nr:Hypothetical predicted protein [Mytilus galloprovincialis]
MANFNGTWFHDGSKDGWERYDEFMDLMGLKEAKDSYRNASTTSKFDVKGNVWTVTHSNSTIEGEKTHVIEVGKEFADKNLDGSDIKVVLEVKNDNEVQESEQSNMEDGEWRSYKIVRQISGDSMTVTIHSKGKSMAYKMKRVK